MGGSNIQESVILENILPEVLLQKQKLSHFFFSKIDISYRILLESTILFQKKKILSDSTFLVSTGTERTLSDIFFQTVHNIQRVGTLPEKNFTESTFPKSFLSESTQLDSTRKYSSRTFVSLTFSSLVLYIYLGILVSTLLYKYSFQSGLAVI